MKIVALERVHESIELGRFYDAAISHTGSAYLYHNSGFGFWLEKNQYVEIKEKIMKIRITQDCGVISMPVGTVVDAAIAPNGSIAAVFDCNSCQLTVMPYQFEVVKEAPAAAPRTASEKKVRNTLCSAIGKNPKSVTIEFFETH